MTDNSPVFSAKNDQPSSVAVPPGQQTNCDSTELMNKFVALLTEKTRFDLSIINLKNKTNYLQEFSFSIKHEIKASIEKKAITGHFVTSLGDTAHKATPVKAAETEAFARLKLASDSFITKIKSPFIKHDSIKTGIFLKPEGVHWCLVTCKHCQGHKQVTCNGCGGYKKVICGHCSGNGKHSCLGCNSTGKNRCYSCHGAGVSQVQVQYVQSQSNYGPVYGYRYETRSCQTCFGSGSITCNAGCYGTGIIRCSNCGGAGAVKCKTCQGVGNVNCPSCEASGKVGVAAWVNVNVNNGYTITISNDAPSQAKVIFNKVNSTRIASLATRIDQVASRIDDGIQVNTPTHFSQTYCGQLKISTLNISYSGKNYELIAYAETNEWFDLDNIITDLLWHDLNQYTKTVTRTQSLSAHKQSLKKLAASKLNVDLMCSFLEKTKNSSVGNLVSEDYADLFQLNFAKSLQLFRKKIAFRHAILTFVINIIVVVVVWKYTYEQTWIILAMILSVVFCSTLFLKWRIKRTVYAVCGRMPVIAKSLNKSPKSTLRNTLFAWSVSIAMAAMLVIKVPVILPKPMTDRQFVNLATQYARQHNMIGPREFVPKHIVVDFKGKWLAERQAKLSETFEGNVQLWAELLENKIIQQRDKIR